MVKPLAGVITTRPATAPEIAPSTVGLPVLSHSTNIQPSAAAAAAKCVATKALAGQTVGGQGAAAVEAEPADPQQRRADHADSTTLCGGIGVLP